MHFPNEVPAVVHHTDAKRKEQFKKMSPDSADLHSAGCSPLKLRPVKRKKPKKVTSF